MQVGLLQPSASSEDIDGLRGQASHPAAEGIIGGRSQAKLEAYTFQTPPRSACGPYVAAAGQYLGFGTFGGLLAGLPLLKSCIKYGISFMPKVGAGS